MLAYCPQVQDVRDDAIPLAHGANHVGQMLGSELVIDRRRLGLFRQPPPPHGVNEVLPVLTLQRRTRFSQATSGSRLDAPARKVLFISPAARQLKTSRTTLRRTNRSLAQDARPGTIRRASDSRTMNVSDRRHRMGRSDVPKPRPTAETVALLIDARRGDPRVHRNSRVDVNILIKVTS